MHINTKDKVKRKLARACSQSLPAIVWEDARLQEMVDDYLDPPADLTSEDAWGLLEQETDRLLRFMAAAKNEVLEGIQAGIPDTEGVFHVADARKSEKEDEPLESASFTSRKTIAMVRAMSELFAELAHQYPEVKQFRERELGGRLLTEDEARSLLASYAARFLTYDQFRKWRIPVIGHRSELAEYDDGLDRRTIDHRARIRVDPPGISKTVRYAYPDGEEPNTRCRRQNKAIIPPNALDAFAGMMPVIVSGDYMYPPYLWPGSVVDELYHLAEELVEAFDWPGRDAAAWFVLTGKAPEVRPIDVRWETKNSRYLNPQWRIRLTVPPWLSEKEVLEAYRLMRKQMPTGTRLPKKSTPLEIAHFVWQQERKNGYEKRSWESFRKQWNEENPESARPTYNDFRMYFVRGNEAVKKLNFSGPTPGGNRAQPLLIIAQSTLQCPIEEGPAHADADNHREEVP